MINSWIVIPCYNEARRLTGAPFLQLSKKNNLLFVNDGSKDETERVLKDLESQSGGRIHILSLKKNSGKGEAVRQGFLYALKENCDIIGYIDADLATPIEETQNLIEELNSHPLIQVVMGSRVRMLGANIDRKGTRHYLGRVFATFASLALAIPVYDTQCGAKFFRTNEAFRSAVSTPFNSKWAFDVELISRLLYGKPSLTVSQFLEVPLKKWMHVGGSKLTVRAMAIAFIDLMKIYFANR